MAEISRGRGHHAPPPPPSLSSLQNSPVFLGLSQMLIKIRVVPGIIPCFESVYDLIIYIILMDEKEGLNPN